MAKKKRQKRVGQVRLGEGLYLDTVRNAFMPEVEKKVRGKKVRMPRRVILKPAADEATEAEAEEAKRLFAIALADWKVAVKAGKKPRAMQTLRDVADERYRLMRVDDAAPRTIDFTRNEVEKHFIPMFGAERPIASIEREDIALYLKKRILPLPSKASRYNLFTVTASLFRVALELGYIKVNPCDGQRPKKPKLKRAGIKSLTPEQRAAYLDAARRWNGENPKRARHIDAECVVRIAITEGFRLGYVRTLEVEEFDFEHGKVNLRDLTGDRKRGGRTVQLFAPLARYLKPWIAKNRPDGGPLFRSPLKSKRYSTQVGTVMKEVAVMAGIPETHHGFNTTRKTFATYMMASGKMDRHGLKKHMGHASMRETEPYLADIPTPHLDAKHNEAAEGLLGEQAAPAPEAAAALDQLGLDARQMAAVLKLLKAA